MFQLHPCTKKNRGKNCKRYAAVCYINTTLQIPAFIPESKRLNGKSPTGFLTRISFIKHLPVAFLQWHFCFDKFPFQQKR